MSEQTRRGRQTGRTGVGGRLAQAVGLAVALFAVVGVGIAVVGYVVVDWAAVQFVRAAGGSAVAEFGPVFVAATALATTAGAFAVGVGFAAVVGALVGSRFPQPRTAAIAGGGGAFVGFVVLASLAVAGVTVAGGAGTEQVYAPVTATVPVGLGAVTAGVVGATAGGVSSGYLR
ncbi:MAG: hypothetical protein ABEJ79_09535 [Halolamina sp.]